MAREVANWSGCYHCRPQHLLRPRSIAEVQSILREGTGPVKACNALPHSPNDIWTCEQGTMICLSTYLKEVVRADENSITVQGGMQVGVLHDRLVELGRSCFGSLPSVQTMTIAGAISTGAHGSDASYGWSTALFTFCHHSFVFFFFFDQQLKQQIN
jgi:FAD/FMN-containing dehydrogenase